MRDIDKTKEQLITELAGLRRLVTELEASKATRCVPSAPSTRL